MKIAVAGGTGVLGALVVAEAEQRGHEPVVLARSKGVDLEQPTVGGRLVELLEGVDAVVDATGVATQKRSRAEEFFSTTTRALLDAEQRAGVGHHVAVSIIGIDRVPLGYYRGKQEQERLVAEGPVPWTVQRISQFHEFAEQVLGFATLGRWSVVPRMTVQPVSAREAASHLVDLAEAGPQGMAPDLAGPGRHQLVTLARQVNRVRSLGRFVVGAPLPGAAGRGMRDGSLTPREAGPRGQVSFEDWLFGGGLTGEDLQCSQS